VYFEILWGYFDADAGGLTQPVTIQLFNELTIQQFSGCMDLCARLYKKSYFLSLYLSLSGFHVHING